MNTETNEAEQLRETCSILRHQLNSAMILLLVVSATVSIFFLRQYTMARQERDALRTQITDYQSNGIPALLEFTHKLQEYSKTHPDVLPILNKYGVMQVTPAANPKK
jgi:hypothetical protein